MWHITTYSKSSKAIWFGWRKVFHWRSLLQFANLFKHVIIRHKTHKNQWHVTLLTSKLSCSHFHMLQWVWTRFECYRERFSENNDLKVSLLKLDCKKIAAKSLMRFPLNKEIHKCFEMTNKVNEAEEWYLKGSWIWHKIDSGAFPYRQI